MNTSLVGFVEGFFVEVLWDVVQTTEEGRRKGETNTEAVWWKAEVLSLRRDGDKVYAKLRYEALRGFRSQVGDVRVFPCHLLSISERDVTQLRWRYFESSGDVKYDTDTTALGSFQDPSCSNDSLIGNSEVKWQSIAYEKLDDLANRVQHMENLITSEREVYKRFMIERSSDQDCIERILPLLRQKLAVEVQKPLVSYKHRKGYEIPTGAQFDFSCAGSMKGTVDCTIGEFERVCEMVRSICPTTFFRADGRRFVPSMGCLPTVKVAEALFCSLSLVCKAIGICHETDILNIAQRERHIERVNNTRDSAIRVAGTFLVDSEVDNTPSAIAVCHGFHEGMHLEEEIAVLKRESRELDPRTVWYGKPLKDEKLSVSSLLKSSYPPTGNSEAPARSNAEMIKLLRREGSCFALRWKPLSIPDASSWTRGMITGRGFAGLLEVDIPFVLIRGQKGFNEFKELVDREYMSLRVRGSGGVE